MTGNIHIPADVAELLIWHSAFTDNEEVQS